MHVNGVTEPAVTVSVPQGTYTSAHASIGSAEFECITLDESGGMSTNFFAYPSVSDSGVTVNLPASIVVSGTSTVLKLDLQVSKSASWTSCHPNGIQPFTITPTFNLSAMALSSAPSSSENGLQTDLKGIVGTVSASSGAFTVVADEGPGCGGTVASTNCTPPAAYAPVWSVVSDSATVYQGLTGISKLTAGMAVDMDAALQADGSLLAKRVSVYDSDTSQLTIADGPLVSYSSVAGYQHLEIAPVRESGLLALAPIPFSYGSAVLQISGRFQNLSDLPFVPSFTAANATHGQYLYASTHVLVSAAAPTYVPAATITLIPQTINGTVSAIGSEGGFTTYTVTLADYDLFPKLAVQAGQTVVTTNPNTVVVYADSNTKMLNAQAIAAGSVVRFYGLILNDNGQLRMDCTQIKDGVAE